MEEVAGEMGVNLDIVEDLREATLLVTSKKYYRQKPQKIRDAESTNLPIYVLKGGTPVQIRQLLGSLFTSSSRMNRKSPGTNLSNQPWMMPTKPYR